MLLYRIKEEWKKSAAGKGKKKNFVLKYFHRNARAYKSETWQEHPPCSSSQWDA